MPVVACTLLQDQGPAQAALHAFEGQHLKQLALIVDGHAPLMIMLIGIVRAGISPGTSFQHGLLL